MQKTFKGAVGFKIIQPVSRDISDATLMEIKYKKPGGTYGEWQAQQENDKVISYTTVSGNLDEAGTWIMQAYIETPAYKLHGLPARLEVEQPVST